MVGVADVFSFQIDKIKRIDGSVRDISNNSLGDSGLDNMKPTLRAIANRIAELQSDLSNNQGKLREIAELYRVAEQQILDNLAGVTSGIGSGASSGASAVQVPDTSGHSNNGGGGAHNNEWLDFVFDLVGETGLIGSGAGLIKQIFDEDGFFSAKGVKALSSLVGDAVDVVDNKNLFCKWAKGSAGIGDLLESNGGIGGIFKTTLKDQFTTDLGFGENALSTTAKQAKVAAKWAGIIATVAGEGFDNYDEFGGFTGRMVGETVIESAAEIGLTAVATAGVTAALAAAGIVGAPAVAVGAGAVLVVAGGNAICKWATGEIFGPDGARDIGECFSDLTFDVIIPGAKMAGDFVVEKGTELLEGAGQALESAGQALESAGEAISDGWNTFTSWAGSLF